MTSVLAVAAMAPPAGAYLTNFEQLRLGTPTSSGTFGGRSFHCPSGKFLIGVGGGVPSGSAYSGLAVNRMAFRTPYQGTGEIGGVETDPHAGLWHMAAQGYCASYSMTPPSAAPNTVYIGDVEVVANQSAMSGADLKTVSAGCLGRESIGGGYSVDGVGGAYSAPDATVHGAFLIDGDNIDGYMARAQEADPSPIAWRLTVWAICAERAPGPRARYIGNTISTPVATSTSASINKGVAARCPGGQRIIGGSAEILGGTDATAPPTSVTLTTSGPSQPGAATAWVGSGMEEDPTSAPWRVRARATCALMVPRS